MVGGTSGERDSRRRESSAQNQIGACTAGVGRRTEVRPWYRQYMEHIVVVVNRTWRSTEMLKELIRHLTITEPGEVSTILGMKIRRDRQSGKVWLTEPAYIERVVERCPGHRPRVTPLPLDRGKRTTWVEESPTAAFRSRLIQMLGLTACSKVSRRRLPNVIKGGSDWPFELAPQLHPVPTPGPREGPPNAYLAYATSANFILQLMRVWLRDEITD